MTEMMERMQAMDLATPDTQPRPSFVHDERYVHGVMEEITTLCMFSPESKESLGRILCSQVATTNNPAESEIWAWAIAHMDDVLDFMILKNILISVAPGVYRSISHCY